MAGHRKMKIRKEDAQRLAPTPVFQVVGGAVREEAPKVFIVSDDKQDLEYDALIAEELWNDEEHEVDGAHSIVSFVQHQRRLHPDHEKQQVEVGSDLKVNGGRYLDLDRF